MKKIEFDEVWASRMGKWAGKKTDMANRIWKMLLDSKTLDNNILPTEFYTSMFNKVISKDLQIRPPKLHAIIEGQKFKAGDIIKPISISPARKEFQFAPEMRIVSVQDIEIRHGERKASLDILIGNDLKWSKAFGSTSHEFEIEFLIMNDGFESGRQFFQYFDSDFSGQIIHFTKLMY